MKKNAIYFVLIATAFVALNMCKDDDNDNEPVIVEDEWVQMESMPYASSYYGSCVDSTLEKVYIFGGSGISNNLSFISKTQIYDLKTGKWSMGEDMQNKSGAFTAEMVNGRIYIIGEKVSPTALTHVEEYDPVNDTWISKSELPEIFYAQGSCVYNGLIYLFGGRDIDFNLIKTVRVYDPIADTFRLLEPMPYAKDKSATYVYNDDIYLFGNIPSLKYSPATDEWTELNTPISFEVRAYQIPVFYKDVILLFGGYKDVTGEYPPPSNEIWAYYILEDNLVKLDLEMPFDRFTRGHEYNNYLYMYGGHYGASLGSVTNEVWRFELDYISEYLAK